MDCKRSEETILTDYLDGRLGGPLLKDLESHLASCSKCRVFAYEAKTMSADIQKAGQLTPPAGLWDKVYAAVAEDKVEAAPAQNILGPIRRLFSQPRQAFAFATAAALVITVLVTARIVSNQLAINRQEEIFSMVDLGDIANGSDYDLGTSVESYLL